MKKKKLGIVASSVAAIAVCSSMVVGSTFALFTSEDKVNVAITAGKVNVTAAVENVETYSMNEKQQAVEVTQNDVKETHYMFENGGFASVNGNGLKINNVTAEDEVRFEIRIANNSNVNVKYRTKVSVKKDNGLAEGLVVTIDSKEFTASAPVYTNWLPLEANVSPENTVKVSVKLPDSEDVNKYNGLEGETVITYAVEAVQGNAEVKNVVLPEGVTNQTFEENNAVAVTSDGKFIENTAAGIKEAINAGGTLYFKEGADVAAYAAHPNVTKDLTIYANGADFGGKDISIGTYASPEKNKTTVNIYGAQNLVVWGQPIVGRADVWNVNFFNCKNEDCGLLMYRSDDTANTAIINFTAEKCTATGYTDSFIHTSADGKITVKSCTFENNPAPINIAHKQSGNMTVSVENCVFVGCGKVDVQNDYFAPARFVNNSATGSLNVNLNNNIFTDTVGTNGDILLGDYREGKQSNALTAVIKTENPVMVKSSNEAAYSYEGGTIELS